MRLRFSLTYDVGRGAPEWPGFTPPGGLKLDRPIQPEGRTGRLTGQTMAQPDVYRMIQRRAEAAGVATKIGCHSWRARGITAYLENGGLLEYAQQMAGHASARTTKLYDRRGEQISLDEVERIAL